MRRRYRLKNKRRFATFVLLFILASVFTGFIVNAGASSPQDNDYQVFKVEEGDTLWEIAAIYSVNSDIREYIYNIKKLNKLSNDTIYAGQILLLP
jgi:hypothetical protein